MAHALNSAQPIIHQALHGYAGGHRQLTLSTTLKPRDQRALLALSDISGPGARLDEEGYLTGFPLSDSGVYALARTWPAPEMSRPGCVWTHTLLIDFTDLGAIDTLADFLSLFRRPINASDVLDYSVPKRLQPDEHFSVPTIAERWTRQVMVALYGKAQSRIVATRLDANVDESVMALWSQQWPRLRRTFQFCTFAISDRSSEAGGFDFQVVPASDRNLRARFSDVVDADAVSSINLDAWLDDAFDDLLMPDRHGLRDFLRHQGAEASGGREAFRPLCQLHQALFRLDVRSGSVRDAVDILEHEFGGKQTQTARAAVAKAALEQVEKLDEQSFDFLWRNLGLLDANTIADRAVDLGRTAWRRDPHKLASLLESDSGLKVVAERMLDALSLSELIDGLALTPELLKTVLAHRPEIVAQAAIWKTPSAVNAAFETAKRASFQSSAIAAILSAGQTALASRAVQEFGSKQVLEALGSADHDEGSALTALVYAATKDSKVVAEFLSSQPSISRSLLYAVALALWPDSATSEYGTDPWLIAWQKAVGSISDAGFVYMAAFLLTRALGSRSRSQAELAQIGFEVTYVAAASNHLSAHSWRLLDSRLPGSDYWFGWDRCQRLRTGVIDLFVDRELSTSLFATLAKDSSLFALLASEAGKSRRGRRYLKRVRDEISNQSGLSDRVHAINSILSYWS
jgi:hypothetical protein